MTRRPDLSIGGWLAIGFGAAVVLLATLAVASLSTLQAIAAQTERQTSVLVPREESAVELRVAVSRVGVAVRMHVLAPGPERKGEAQREIAAMHDVAERVRAQPDVAEGGAPSAAIPALVEAYGARAQAVLEARDARQADLRLAEAREALLSRLGAYLEFQREKLARSRDEIAWAQRRSRDLLVWTALVVAVLLAAVAYLVSRGVRAPALALADAARRVADGDWAAGTALAPPAAAAARTRNELKDVARSFARMAEALQEREARLSEQNGRLQSDNAQLQAQSRELHAQSEQLQGQNEELRAQGDELRRTQEQLRQADQRKDEFLAVLSHELRNPLASIVNALALLERAESRGEQAQRSREIIGRQVRQLTRLIDDLLDVTRVSRGKVRLQRTHLAVGPLVRQTADDCRSLMDRAGLTFDVHVPEGPLWIDADPARVAQVVSNLLHNAAKFTARGGTVSLAVEERDRRVAIRVRDDGIGISREVLSRLFTPFVQADNSLERTRGGLGLGLALVKGLVELHGGTVTVSSAGLGSGSEFTVELPLAGQELLARRPAAAPPARTRRILVIEDNVDGAETLRDLLALHGHVVELALDGEEGLRKARALRPDLVLCDVGLPAMDGYEVARRIREDPELRQTLVVALTGYARPEDHRRAADAGFHAHLPKPATLECLETVIAEAGSDTQDDT